MGRSPLAHPWSLLAIAVLIVNDHLLKWVWPGVVTGKLSDFAGLVCFPLLLLALLEPWCPRGRDRRVAGLVAGLTALGFAMVKTWPPANHAHAVAWGLLQWPGAAVQAWLAGSPSPPRFEVECVRDPTDLIALPAVLVAVWLVPSARDDLRAHEVVVG